MVTTISSLKETVVEGEERSCKELFKVEKAGFREEGM